MDNQSYKERSAHLKNLTDQELKDRFWALTEKVIDPLLTLGFENTTPAIERSVLLRMGFSSLEVKPIVDGVLDRGLLGYGAGNVVYRISKEKNISIREAGLGLIDGFFWDDALELFK